MKSYRPLLSIHEAFEVARDLFDRLRMTQNGNRFSRKPYP
jgi:hypothetical protein